MFFVGVVVAEHGPEHVDPPSGEGEHSLGVHLPPEGVVGVACLLPCAVAMTITYTAVTNSSTATPLHCSQWVTDIRVLRRVEQIGQNGPREMKSKSGRFSLSHAAGL